MLHDKRVREDIKQRFYIHINTETFIKNKEIFMTITVLGSITGHVVTAGIYPSKHFSWSWFFTWQMTHTLKEKKK